MSTLVAERRLDRNGVLVTRHVRPQSGPSRSLAGLPAPMVATAAPELVEFDDLNVMVTVGVRDYASGACERVEEYLQDEYGAAFDYDTETGAEIVRFTSADDADRFDSDFHEGSLRDELRGIVQAS